MKKIYNTLRTTRVALVALLTGFLMLSSFLTYAQEAHIETDKLDYVPGETVIITGYGWLADETVQLKIDHLVFEDHPDEYFNAYADLNGEILHEEYVIEEWDRGETFLITATGLSSGYVATWEFTDAGGSYTIKIFASDPALNSTPYLPTYEKVPPSLLDCLTENGRADDPLADAVLISPTSGTRDAVTSLAPEDMALCQIVPFQFEISVSGTTQSENGVITFLADWNTKTTNGGDFGYDPGHGLYCAFVDYGDVGTFDPDGNARVQEIDYDILDSGTSTERIQGTITVSGLEDGDVIIVEAWVVLKCYIEPKTGGNVQTSLIQAFTGTDPLTGDVITTGNQTVPLLRVGEFFTADVDLDITKTDTPDPYTFCQSDLANSPLSYTITISNAGPSIANGVVVTDVLDGNIASIVGNSISISSNMTDDLIGVWGVDLSAFPTITFGTTNGNTASIMMLEEVKIEFDVILSDNAPHTGTGGVGNYGTCPDGNNFDLCNYVSVSTISDDTDDANNDYYQPTGLECETDPPEFTNCPTVAIDLGCNPTPPTCEDARLEVEATDLCSEITLDCSAGAITGDDCNKTQIFTIIATDFCGNTATCDVTYTWTVDLISPSITCPIDITVCESETVPTISVPTATDNCDTEVEVTWVRSDGEMTDLNAPFGIGITMITFTAVDDCLNSANCAMTVNIYESPVCDISATGDYTTTDEGVDLIDPLTYITYCAPEEEGMTYSWTCSTSSFTSAERCITVNEPGIYTVTITNSDNCTSTCSRQLDYKAGSGLCILTGPTPVCPGSTNTYTTTTTIPVGFTYNWFLVDNTNNATFTVAEDEMSVDVVASSTCNSAYTVLLQIKNASGSVVKECEVTVTVDDDVLPVFDIIENLELTCYDQDAIDAWLALATASDNCGGSVEITNNFVAPTTACKNGTYTVTFTAEDECENIATVTADIVVNDDVAPVFTNTFATLELTCYDQDAIDAWLALATASDNCGGSVEITNNYEAPVGECLNGTYPVTFTATDECGNEATVTVNIVINDNTPPDIKCPDDVVVNCGDDTSPDPDGRTGVATATDNCDGNVDIAYQDAKVPTPGCATTETITRTWTATDDCGNFSTCEQKILVASIDIVKTFTDDEVIAGGAASTFTLVVTNDGSAPLSNVAIYDDVDDRLTVTDVTGSAGVNDDSDGVAQTVEWLIASMEPGDIVTITVTFQVASDVEEANGVGGLNGEDNVPNTATVNAVATDDTDIKVSDEDDDDINIKVIIDLTIDKEFVPAEIQVPQGTFQTFTLVVTNNGPSDAVDVLVTDLVHTSLEITNVTVTVGEGDCSASDGQNVDCTVQIPAGELVIIEVEYLTAPFLDGDTPYGTGAGDDFYFVFVNGSVLEGSTDGGPIFLDGVDITDQVQIITSLTRNDIIFDPPGDDPAFEMHLSCSDPFTDGWGQSAGPVEGIDVNWQIAFFTIARFNANGYIKSCGNVTVPYEIPNTGFAFGDDSNGTQEVDDDATVTVIPGITLTDLTTLGKRLTARLTNMTGDAKVIDEVTIRWPENNGDLIKVWLVTGNITEVIWEGNYAWAEDGAILNTEVSGWYGSTLLTGEAILRFDFVNKVADTSYIIRVWFRDGTWLDIHSVGDQPIPPPPATDLSCSTDIQNVSEFKGSDGKVTVSFTGGVAPYSVCLNSVCKDTPEESDGEYDVVFENLSAGNYNYLVTDAQGSTCAGAVTITQPKNNPKSAEIATGSETVFVNSELKVYPNPFSDKVMFEFVAAEDARARLEITNILGQRVAILMDQHVQKGVLNRVEYEPMDVVSQMLIYRLILDDNIQTGRIIYKKE